RRASPSSSIGRRFRSSPVTTGRCEITVRILITRILIITLVLAADLAVPSLARSQTNLALVPSVSVSTISDDNIFTSTTRSADQTTVLSPSLEGSVDTPRTSLLGLYSFDMLRSAYFAALDNIEARRHGMFDTHFRHT